MKYLVDKGANLDLQGIFLILKHLVSFIYSYLDHHGNSPALLAASKNHVEIMTYLGEKGAKLNLQGMFLFFEYLIFLINPFV